MAWADQCGLRSDTAQPGRSRAPKGRTPVVKVNERLIEILAGHHRLLVLQRQLGKPTFTDTDRAVLAGLLHQLPMDKLRHLLLLVHPDTILRWQRDLEVPPLRWTA
ncbi:hypothetical protein AB0N06_37860 [Streptomyces sp. NPDC051020]|uniref:hypothetical protein n=1 Tax=Streptomyces sp. NPDC051020 TaxID=3155409 RepID=UPI00343F7539